MKMPQKPIRNLTWKEIEVAQKTIHKFSSMTYQRTAKETVAAHYGLPFEKVDLPFNEWMALRERYERETGKQL